ncbi:MFS transporter [candidate division WOR-3 bacterium]|nr:MFS transporter [candidate division WOR-3 bacterium]
MYKPTNKEWSWAMYDFGNSAYALIVMTIFFPLFFAEYIVSGKLTAALWGLSVAISILLVGLISPLLGALADKEAKRKSYFVLFSIMAIIGTMVLSFTAYIPLYLGILIFILVNFSFGLALSLYDSFITVVPQKKNVSTTLSGIGWAIGYIGGPLCLLIAWFLMGRKLPVDLSDYRTLFLVTGLFFFAFSIWPYLSLPKDKLSPAVSTGLSALRTVWQTLRSWRNRKHIFIFLIAMYFLMDGLTTMVYFVSLFAKVTLGFTIEQIVILLLIVQGIGIFTTAIMSWLAEKFGEIRLLILCSILWIVISFLIFFSSDYASFRIVAYLTGIVIGSTPAIARGFLGKIIPVEKRAEFFGFNTLAGRMATLIGPLVFGIAAYLWNMRIAILTVVPFFVIGAILLIYLNMNFKRWQNA